MQRPPAQEELIREAAAAADQYFWCAANIYDGSKIDGRCRR
jgi:hypothetical protein